MKNEINENPALSKMAVSGCFVQRKTPFSRNEQPKILNTMTPYQFEKLTQSFCKLKSTCGLNNDLDIHGMPWNERVVCKIIMYDRTNGLLHVENANGLKWFSDLKSMEFCLEDGSKTPS